MTKKKITLNELRSIVKQIIKEESSKNFEIIITYKELNKDGGKNYTKGFLVNSDSESEAKKIAKGKFDETFGDDSDLSIVSIKTYDEHKKGRINLKSNEKNDFNFKKRPINLKK